MERLRELRKKAGKTQSEVASVLKMTQAGYQKYENMQTEPNIENLIKLADFYNVSLDSLVGRRYKELDLTKSEVDFIKLYRQLDESNKKIIYYEAKGVLLAQEKK